MMIITSPRSASMAVRREGRSVPASMENHIIHYGSAEVRDFASSTACFKTRATRSGGSFRPKMGASRLKGGVKGTLTVTFDIDGNVVESKRLKNTSESLEIFECHGTRQLIRCDLYT